MGKPGRPPFSEDEKHRSMVLSVYRGLVKKDKVLIDGPAYKRMKHLARRWG
jgi:hypothetical protein